MATIRRREGRGGRVSWQVVLSVTAADAGLAKGAEAGSALAVGLADLRGHLDEVIAVAVDQSEVQVALKAIGKQVDELAARGTLRAGRARPVRTFSRERDAKAWARKMESDRDDGALVLPSKTSLGTFLVEKWLPAKRASVRPSTFESYSRNIARHVVPHLGGVPLQALSADKLNAWYAELLTAGRGHGRGLSVSTVRYVHTILAKALSDAVRWGMVARNVAGAADPPKASAGARREMQTWSAEQVSAFLDQACGDRLEAAFVLAITTGMRRGEVLGLRWIDVDLDRPSLCVRQSLISVAYRLEISAPKTARGERVISLDGTTAAALRAHRRRQLEEHLARGEGAAEAGLVFTRENGAPVHPDHLSDRFGRLSVNAGLPRIRFHDLRHTCATLALAAGVPAEVISDRLGHARRSFTVDRYTHAVPALSTEAAGRLEAAIFGAGRFGSSGAGG